MNIYTLHRHFHRLISRIQRHGCNDTVCAGAGDAHGRPGQPDHTGFNRRIAEQGRCFLLILRNDHSAVSGEKIRRIGGPRTADSFFKQLPVELISFIYKTNLLDRNCFHILYHLLQCIPMDQMHVFLLHLLPAFLRKYDPAVLRNLYNIRVGIPDDHRTLTVFSCHLCFYEDPAGNFTHIHRDFSVIHHLTGHHLIFLCDSFQTFQPFLRISRHSAKRRRIIIAHLTAARNPAGKGIFKHTAVQPQRHVLNRSLYMFSRCRYCKSDRTRLSHTECGLHIVPD